jgi:hypothetical protein
LSEFQRFEYVALPRHGVIRAENINIDENVYLHMKPKIFLMAAALLTGLISCNWAKNKTGQAINGTGEVVGKAGSEFASGIAKGVEKTFSHEIVFSPALVQAGLGAGKIVVRSQESGGNDNILSPYLIYNEAIDRDIIVKLFTEDGLEYGRVTQHIKGAKGSAGFVDVVFDARTNIDLKGKITLE